MCPDCGGLTQLFEVDEDMIEEYVQKTPRLQVKLADLSEINSVDDASEKLHEWLERYSTEHGGQRFIIQTVDIVKITDGW